MGNSEAGRSRGGGRTERPSKGIGNSFFSSWDVYDVTGELGDVGKMALLSGGPGRRGVKQGLRQGLVVGEESEFTTLQEKSEVTNKGICCHKLSVKGGVLGFYQEKFLGEKD